jgi:hypothetical protein
LLAAAGIPGNTALLDHDNLKLKLTNTPEPALLSLFGAGLVGPILLLRRSA